MMVQAQCGLVPAGERQFNPTMSPVSNEQRLDSWPSYFSGIPQWTSLEPRIFVWADCFCDEYNGGTWSFYTLSSDGAFMAPDADGGGKWHLFDSMNGNDVEMNVGTAGITVCLIEYNHHVCCTECDAMTEHYYRLRNYALLHPEFSTILRIIN